MKKFLIILLTLLFVPVGVVYSQEKTQWQKVDENNYINLEGIAAQNDIYGYSFLLKSYNKGQYEPVFGKEILYTLSQYTVDCSNQTYKIGVIDSYGYNDNFINGDYNRYASFQPIIGGTAVNSVAKKLCKIK